ncbi:MAG: YIP1 family protein [Ignavibacteria bacterium]|nr:YIP1 family protein [Ignavibacteria bacterium]
MSEDNFTDPEQNTVSPEQFEVLSKADAMAGVFTAPGETYETISNTPKQNYWIIPVVMAIVAGIIGTFLFMQDAQLVGSVMDKQKQKMQEQFDKNIKEGKMTQEDADKAMESMNPKGTFFKIIGFGGSLIGPFLILFILSIVYLIVLKIMKAEFEFANILNVVGLAMLITSVGGLLGIVISVLKGEMSSVSLGLILSEGAVGEKVHSFLNKLDVFSIWFYVVVAIGLSKVARIDMVKSASVVFAIFLIYAVVTSFIF